MHILLNERSQSEKVTYCMFPITTLCRRQNPGDSKNVSGCQGLKRKEEERSRWSTWDFLEQ